jgi:hypothetical protein
MCPNISTSPTWTTAPETALVYRQKIKCREHLIWGPTRLWSRALWPIQQPGNLSCRAEHTCFDLIIYQLLRNDIRVYPVKWAPSWQRQKKKKTDCGAEIDVVSISAALHHVHMWYLINENISVSLLSFLLHSVTYRDSICLSIYLSTYLAIFVPVAPTWSIGHSWNASFHFSFLILDSQ